MNLRPRQIDFDEAWKELRHTVEAIVQLQYVKRITWDHNFSDIYFICVSIPEAQSQRLYNALKECLREHAKQILARFKNVHSDDLLKEYNKEWHKFHKGATYLQNLFGYLNKQLMKERYDAESQHIFLPVESDMPLEYKGVGNLALDIWKEELVVPLSVQLTPFIVSIIAKDRLENGNVDSTNARHAVYSLVDLNELFDSDGFQTCNKVPFSHSQVPVTEFYQKIFEKPFLQETVNYYKYLTNEVFADLDCPLYMEKVLQKMDEEKSRARRFLHTSSIPKVERLCSEYLVNAQLDRLNSVCSELIQKEQLNDLRNMHTLLKPLNNVLIHLVTEFEKHVRKQSMGLLAASGAEPSQFVSNIQALHEKYSKMVIEIFRDDGEFVAALDRALQHVVNNREDPKQPPKVSERLNRYIDSLLRKTAKGLSEADIDSYLTKAITIFRYIDDKDLFQKYYSKMLSNRLIGNLSFSMDFEESMIAKMKEACGYEFTNKLSRMFTDVGLSRSLTERFISHLKQNKAKLETPATVMVLQAGAWPLSAQTNENQSASTGTTEPIFQVPSMLKSSLEHFENFYSENHTGRKLSWLYGSSTAEIKLLYLDKKYVVSMNIYQLSILLLFSDEDVLSLETIASNTAIPKQTILKCVKGFIDIGLLFFESGQSEDLCNIAFRLNLSMTSKRLRFKIVMPQTNKPQEKEADPTCNTLQQDRKYYMECAIVRIMKARKVMKHGTLIEEVIKQTASRFVPDVAFIKRNIEALIEKLYLQRTDQNDEYQYLA